MNASAPSALPSHTLRSDSGSSRVSLSVVFSVVPSGLPPSLAMA